MVASIYKFRPHRVAPPGGEVRLYLDAGTAEPPTDKRSAQPSRNSPKQAGRKLTEAERAVLEGAIRQAKLVKRGNAEADAACTFNPHHFLRWSDGAGQQRAELSICFCCGGFSISPRPVDLGQGWAIDVDEAAIFDLVKSMGLPTDIGCT